jgi:hypothetical protein
MVVEVLRVVVGRQGTALEPTDGGSVQSAVYNVFTRTALIKGTVELREGRDLTGFQEPQCDGNVGGASHRSRYR